MRDPKRIDATLDVLREYWMQNPDLRLAQVIVNACRVDEPCPEVFYTEDDVLLAKLRAMLDEPGAELTG